MTNDVKGNFTTQVMDAHHTYKGNRKKANRGVFKLLRLKSSRLLRSYRRRPPTRIQKCSRCKQVGHNALSKSCPGRVIAQVEGGVVQALQEDEVGAEALQGGAPEDGGVALDDTVFDLEDLLGESEEELY